MGDCKNCNSCDNEELVVEVELETEEETHQAEWIEEQIGECLIDISHVKGALTGSVVKHGEILFPNIGLKLSVSLDNTYTDEDIEDISLMLARVLRAFFIRTQLFPLLTCAGLEN